MLRAVALNLALLTLVGAVFTWLGAVTCATRPTPRVVMGQIAFLVWTLSSVTLAMLVISIAMGH